MKTDDSISHLQHSVVYGSDNPTELRVGQKVRTQRVIKKDINRREKVCGRRVEGI
jgi:hypothetical protein